MPESNIPERRDSTRRPRTLLALLGGIVAPGVSFLYVNRPVLALLPLLGAFGISAIAGWTRLVLIPAGLYAMYVIAIAVTLFSIIYPVLIAYRTEELPRRAYNRVWVYAVWFVLVVLVVNLIAANRAYLFGFEPFRIPSSSMAPTLRHHDEILVDTWRYRESSPQLDELVVFDLPDGSGLQYVFRVVGLPGDAIEIRDDVLFRNGNAINESFTQHLRRENLRLTNYGPVVVPDDHCFVLGDNRHSARDSRYIGPVSRDLLHGRVEFRWFAYDEGIDWSRFPTRLVPD